jgi:hypothetical protein
MSSSKKARVELSSRLGGVEFSLVNSNFEQVAQGTGNLDARVDPGIYQLEVRAGPRSETNLIVLEPGARHQDLDITLEFPSAAPLNGTTTSHEYQQDAAVAESAKLERTRGSRPGLVVVVRNVKGTEELPFNATTTRSLSLLDGNLRPVSNFRSRSWRRNDDQGWATWSGPLDPGGHILRVRHGKNETGTAVTIDQSVWVNPGWQTLLFIPTSTTGPTPAAASIHMSRGPWDPGSYADSLESSSALELALWGLRQGRPVVQTDLLDLLLGSKFENPMLGIVGAHALLLEPTPDLDRFDTVLGNLRALVPEHPDVAALSWLGAEAHATASGSPASYPVISVAWPPTLAASYAALIRLDARAKGGVKPDSVAERIAANLVVQSVWTSWRPIKALSATATPSRQRKRPTRPQKGAGTARKRSGARPPADPATLRVERYLEEVGRVKEPDSQAELLTEAGPAQISVATTLSVASVRRALGELSSEWIE